MKQIVVDIKGKPSRYPVYIGSGILESIAGLCGQSFAGKKLFIISNPLVFRLYGSAIYRGLKKNFNTGHFLIPDGERYKDFTWIKKSLEAMLSFGMERRDAVIAIGGGVTGDTAGFAAASYMRGIPLVHVPTTLIAQVDSSIGGKVGVNLKEGKNLAGAFYQPEFILADTSCLKTLKNKDIASGMAEVIKYGIIRDKKLYHFILDNRDKIKRLEKASIMQTVYMSALNKAEVVARDEKEANLRMILNFGHTIGHALEAATNYKVFSHGAAVAIGSIYAFIISMEMGICKDASYYREIKELFEFFSLPVRIPAVLPAGIPRDLIYKKLFVDKKISGKKLRMILPVSPGSVRIVDEIDNKMVKKILSDKTI